MSRDIELLPEVADAVRAMAATLEDEGLLLKAAPVEYGARLVLSTAAGHRVTGHIYYSRKKRRYSAHVPPGQDPSLTEHLQQSAATVCEARVVRAPDSTPRPEAPLSGIVEVDKHVALVLPRLHSAGFFAEVMEPIPYGLKLVLSHGETKIPINLYYSRKKGLNVVAGQRVPPGVAREVLSLILPGSREWGTPEERALKSWIGTDEAGKGDYFGPLVTAAVFLDERLAAEVIGQGAVDSKRLKPVAVAEIAARLRRSLGKGFAVVEIGPERYNQLYEEGSRRGEKLNSLLAWSHGRAVKDLVDRGVQFEAIVVDRFTHPAAIRRKLPAGAKLIARVRAEDNPAVAAASILARDAYLKRLERLSETFGVKLMSGASQAVLTAGRKLVARHGPEILERVGKAHFATTKQILSG